MATDASLTGALKHESCACSISNTVATHRTDSNCCAMCNVAERSATHVVSCCNDELTSAVPSSLLAGAFQWYP
jgi:hypothetical protein